MADDVSFTFRMPRKLHERLMHAIAATESEVTRSGVCIQALEQLLAQLEVCPAMLRNYDPARDKSARQNARARRKSVERKTEGEP